MEFLATYAIDIIILILILTAFVRGFFGSTLFNLIKISIFVIIFVFCYSYGMGKLVSFINNNLLSMLNVSIKVIDPATQQLAEIKTIDDLFILINALNGGLNDLAGGTSLYFSKEYMIGMSQEVTTGASAIIFLLGAVFVSYIGAWIVYGILFAFFRPIISRIRLRPISGIINTAYTIFVICMFLYIYKTFAATIYQIGEFANIQLIDGSTAPDNLKSVVDSANELLNGLKTIGSSVKIGIEYLPQVHWFAFIYNNMDMKFISFTSDGTTYSLVQAFKEFFGSISNSINEITKKVSLALAQN